MNFNIDINHKTSFSSIITNYRDKNGISLRAFGNLVGLSFSYISKIEKGEYQPPKDTVGLIAEKIGLSPYRAMLSAGYVVDLEKDIKTRDLNYTFDDLKKSVKRYKIFALSHLREIIKYKGITDDNVKRIFGIDKHYLMEVIHGYQDVTIDLAMTMCVVLGIKFYEGFQVARVNYTVRFIGMVDEEDLAMQIHKYIEKYKVDNYLDYAPDAMADEVAASYIPDEEIMFLNEIDYSLSSLTKDEYTFLKEQLELYRRLNLRCEGKENIL